MTPDYRMKRTIPCKFIVLEPHQYKIRARLGNAMKVRVFIDNKNTASMTFWLSKKGHFFINSGADKRALRKNDAGEHVTYAIPSGSGYKHLTKGL